MEIEFQGVFSGPLFYFIFCSLGMLTEDSSPRSTELLLPAMSGDAPALFTPPPAAELSCRKLGIVFSGTWQFPKTISDYQEGFECLLSCRPTALFNSAFNDSHWQAGTIFPALNSPKARQSKNMSLNKWAISASWLFPIELYLFCIILHCCLEVFIFALNFSGLLISLSKCHSRIAYSSGFSAFTQTILKKIWFWESLHLFSELPATEDLKYTSQSGGSYGPAWQLKGIRKTEADSGH